MESMGFQLFFNVITAEIDPLLHVLWHFSYTLVIELSHHVANRTLTDFKDPFAQLVNCHMLILKHFLFLLHFCNCFGRPERCSSWMSAHPYINSLNHFRRFLTFIHCGPYTLHNWWWVSMGVVPLALKKWITAHISHLAGVARGSSIANSSTVKAECRNWLCSLGIWRGGA